MKGLVLRSTGRWYDVLFESELYRCSLRGSIRLHGMKTTNPVAVGDIVHFIEGREPFTGIITDVDLRKNVIIRRATNLSRQTHILAANVDLIIPVITPLLPRTSTGFIDRVLISAESYHVPSLLVFNKFDLFEEELSLLEEYEAIYHSAGYQTIRVSALRGDGIQELVSNMVGKTVMLTGHSGVGKTALINAIQPALKLKTGDISLAHLKGKHTTTFAQIHFGPDQSLLIDTPGIKEFGVVDFEPWELGHWFPDFRKFIPHCRYKNCTHRNEPACAVREAVENAIIHTERYSNYLGILGNIAQ